MSTQTSGGAAPKLEQLLRGPAAGQTANQVTSQSPASDRAMEAQRAYDLAQQAQRQAMAEQQQREQEALAEEQRRQEQITSDRLEMLGPALDWYVREMIRKPGMADMAPRTGAEIGLVLGAVYGLMTSTHKDKPMLEVVERTVSYGAIGGGLGYMGGHGVRSVARMQLPQVPRRMPVELQRQLRRRLGATVEPWRWQAMHETWADLADQHNGARGPGLSEVLAGAGAAAGGLRALKV